MTDVGDIVLGILQLVVGGALGGVARWILLNPKSWTDRVGMVVMGAIMGYYVGPQALPVILGLMTSGWLFGLKIMPDMDKLPGFSAFAVGASGVALLGIGVDWIAAIRRKRAQIDPIIPTGEAK